MAQSARSFSSAALQKYIQQNNHGFTVGLVISFNGSVYAKAQADTLPHCQGVLMVSSVIDANNFYASQEGYMFNLPTARTPGLQWYVDPVNPGLLTNIMPTSTGQVILPCFVSTSSFEGWFYTGSGIRIEPAVPFGWIVQTGDGALNVNTGYFSLTGSTNNLTLPSTAQIGDEIIISSIGGNFMVKQTGVQLIEFGNIHTTAGPTGTITSTGIGDTITIVCYQTNDRFQVISSMGNLIYA